MRFVVVATVTATATLASPAFIACAPPLDVDPGERACVAELGDALPETLSETGLDDVDCVKPYEPRAWLWSDGADKSRSIMLPDVDADGEPLFIDDSDVDHWRLPVGTKLWKTFSVDGKNVETRFLWQREPNLWDRGVYAWNDDDTASSATLIGRDVEVEPDVAVVDARGTNHDIPSNNACTRCHGESMEPIGFAAVQLGHDDVTKGVTTSSLLADGRFTHDNTPAHVALPGDPLDQQVIGALHASCGHCHRDGGEAEYLTMRIRLEVGKLASVEDTAFFQTTVDVDAQTAAVKRIAPGATEPSLIPRYMAHRGPITDEGTMQMPPLGTKRMDIETLTALRSWIARLPSAP